MHAQDLNRVFLDRCPDCGYLLMGLLPNGQCPECGFSYNADMIVLYGWGFGHNATMANRKWSSAGLGCVLVPLGLLAAGAVWFFVDTMKLAWYWGSWAVILLVLPLFLPALFPTVQLGIGLVIGLLRRHQLRREGLPPVQVRLFCQGFAQREGLGSTRIRPWKKRRVRIDYLDSSQEKGRYRCRIEAPRLGPLPLWPNPVDFELSCDCRTADLIRQRLNEWGVLDRH